MKRKFSPEERERIERLRRERTEVAGKIEELKEIQGQEDKSVRELKLESAPKKELETRLGLARKKRNLEEKRVLSKTLTSASTISNAKLVCETCGREYTEVARERAGERRCVCCGVPISQSDWRVWNEKY
jgi:hypothetical protein